MKLSVIIPVYNEVHTLAHAIADAIAALPHVPKEVIIVDDGSTDGTREWLSKAIAPLTHSPLCHSPLTHPSLTDSDGHDGPIAAPLPPDQLQHWLHLVESFTNPDDSEPPPAAIALEARAPVTLQAILHDRNRGKGAALRTGFSAVTGDVIVIQDADLEYSPHDWGRMWQLIAKDRADVVYGSRFYGAPHRVLYFHHLLGNQVITNLVNLLCNTTFTDIEVCSKMFRRAVVDELKLVCNDFGFEVEFTIKMSLSPRRWRLYEMGITYYGRTYAEGKKINWRDGVKALWYILWFRLTAFS